jgi:glycosyltransferase involved in cell wall biosynthesis
MKKLGIVVRADDGGLGVQTRAYVEHLRPEAVMVVRVDPPRGTEDLDRIGKRGTTWTTCDPDHDLDEWAGFLDAVDVVLTAETWYCRDVPEMAARAHTKLVVHANPELWRAPRHPVECWIPTGWERDRMPDDSIVVPVPVDRSKYPPVSPVEQVRRVLHISAPAMEDRNGTEIVKRACRLATVPFTLVVAGPDRPDAPTSIGLVKVEGLERVDDEADLYADVDALVLPRRYGGLSLPMQEAAAAGLPIVSLDLEPQRRELHRDLLVTPTMRRYVQMKGGSFAVHGADSADLARTLDRLVTEDPAPWVEASAVWAETLDWTRWEPRYNALLRGTP